jgi:hypothetical protein
VRVLPSYVRVYTLVYYGKIPLFDGGFFAEEMIGYSQVGNNPSFPVWGCSSLAAGILTPFFKCDIYLFVTLF